MRQIKEEGTKPKHEVKTGENRGSRSEQATGRNKEGKEGN